MALIRGAFGGAQIKGSIASVTFQGGPAGTIARTRTVPVNPNTPLQVAIRAVLGGLSNEWSNTLNNVERAAWNEYAEMTPLPNRFGELVNKGGRQMFFRTNVIWVKAGLPTITMAPLTPGLAPPIAAILSMNTTDGLELIATGPVVPAGSIVFIRTGRAVGLARNFYKAPFSETAVVNDSSVFPITMVPNTSVGINSRRFVAARHVAVDGKVSDEVIVPIAATA